MNIYLIGMPGSGKTTLGKRLAKTLGFSFTDLDIVLAEQEKMPVTEIFAQKGESYFRQAESECLKGTLQLQKSVIATGGGTPCFFDNMAWMNEHGITIFLDVSTDELVKRLTSSEDATQKRPLFANKSVEELRDSIDTMQVNRVPHYEKSQFRFFPHETKPSFVASQLKERFPDSF
ncbi:shikimate kinase [Cytophagaceae bacterium DM2B3-1]|uniref:Shikimate kinase n=1 Tax=Xanthocytophaga flava TaxID=3048013 RepID=A0ABT7CGG8_9BACT|nr:shikimate kinase [Xanthocytophaga flavus]MDJ1492839.1 shikimate kinase [Xanthocytophaga flavus]